MTAPTIKVARSISEVSANDWDSLSDGYPFARHAFLLALEESGSIGGDSGWQSLHILIYKDEELIAAIPSYEKYHSWGEYVFDWAWADAYQQLGEQYYPKLLSCIPFTPATGPRLLCKTELSANELGAICKAIKQYCQDNNLSSWHVLFSDSTTTDQLSNSSLLKRTGIQYHWFNHGYHTYDDFLARCSSRKRKELRKERKRTEAYDLKFEQLREHEISASDWERFYYFYQTTYAKRSGHGGYLNKEFFQRLTESGQIQLLLVFAYYEGEAIAGALNFIGNDTLYGRYWGCLQELDSLHFETCYYQGIDYCIANGLKKFDAGAQGEHKIQRGFEPVYTYSNHWLANERLLNAVADFVEREQHMLEQQFSELRQKLPFKAELKQ